MTSVEDQGACPMCGDVHRGDGRPQRNCCHWSDDGSTMCACCKADAFPLSLVAAADGPKDVCRDCGYEARL